MRDGLDAEQLAELEAVYELEPYGPAGGDEALAAQVAATINYSDRGPKDPVQREDVCPRLKLAKEQGAGAPGRLQSAKDMELALEMTAIAFGSKSKR